MTHEPIVGSDHCLIVIVSHYEVKKSRRPFHFEQLWSEEPSCDEIIKNTWNKHKHRHISWVIIKLKKCRANPNTWAKGKFGKNIILIREVITIIMRKSKPKLRLPSYAKEMNTIEIEIND